MPLTITIRQDHHNQDDGAYHRTVTVTDSRDDHDSHAAVELFRAAMLGLGFAAKSIDVAMVEWAEPAQTDA